MVQNQPARWPQSNSISVGSESFLFDRVEYNRSCLGHRHLTYLVASAQENIVDLLSPLFRVSSIPVPREESTATFYKHLASAAASQVYTVSCTAVLDTELVSKFDCEPVSSGRQVLSLVEAHSSGNDNRETLLLTLQCEGFDYTVILLALHLGSAEFLANVLSHITTRKRSITGLIDLSKPVESLSTLKFLDLLYPEATRSSSMRSSLASEGSEVTACLSSTYAGDVVSDKAAAGYRHSKAFSDADTVLGCDSDLSPAPHLQSALLALRAEHTAILEDLRIKTLELEECRSACAELVSVADAVLEQDEVTESLPVSQVPSVPPATEAVLESSGLTACEELYIARQKLESYEQQLKGLRAEHKRGMVESQYLIRQYNSARDEAECLRKENAELKAKLSN